MYSLKDKACIVGVGESAFSRGSGKTELQLLLEASVNAISDAGLKPHDIDGIIGPPSAQPRSICRQPRNRGHALRDDRSHGRSESRGFATKRGAGGRLWNRK